MAGCCDPREPRVRKLKVGNGLVGIKGLDAIISEVKSMGQLPKEEIKAELLKLAQSYNYIPDSAREKYAEALYREYINNIK